MKKFLSLLFVFTLIACGGGSDDDESMGRTTDPLIGIWAELGPDGVALDGDLTVNSNGTWSLADPEGPFTGSWTNSGSDFDSLVQDYSFSSTQDGETLSWEERITFSSDFDRYTLIEENGNRLTYVRR